MEKYSSNLHNIQRNKIIRTLPVQTASLTSVTPLKIRSKRSKVGIVQNNLIHYYLQSECLTAQKASYRVYAFSSNLTSNICVSPPKPDKNISQ